MVIARDEIYSISCTNGRYSSNFFTRLSRPLPAPMPGFVILSEWLKLHVSCTFWSGLLCSNEILYVSDVYTEVADHHQYNVCFGVHSHLHHEWVVGSRVSCSCPRCWDVIKLAVGESHYTAHHNFKMQLCVGKFCFVRPCQLQQVYFLAMHKQSFIVNNSF